VSSPNEAVASERHNWHLRLPVLALAFCSFSAARCSARPLAPLARVCREPLLCTNQTPHVAHSRTLIWTSPPPQTVHTSRPRFWWPAPTHTTAQMAFQKRLTFMPTHCNESRRAQQTLIDGIASCCSRWMARPKEQQPDCAAWLTARRLQAKGA
jgi:hypothetical protein